jgi:hypothetical protein
MSKRRDDLHATVEFHAMRGPVSCDRPPRRKQIVNSRSNEPRRNNAVGTGRNESCTRHSINYRACTILNDCAAACSANRAKSFRSVASHACQHDSNKVFTKHIRCTRKKWIGRWPDAANRWIRVGAYDDLFAPKLDGHVSISRSEVNVTRVNALVVFCDCDRKRTEL